jgi:hypothetical protein
MYLFLLLTLLRYGKYKSNAGMPRGNKRIPTLAHTTPIYIDDDVYFKNITTRVPYKIILHKNADQHIHYHLTNTLM